MTGAHTKTPAEESHQAYNITEVSPTPDLSNVHCRTLLDESRIYPEISAERGYYTAERPSEVPEAFADYQRSPGLVVPMFSPDGTSSSYQLRPDKPRLARPKYETPADSEVLVDVHPRMLEEVRRGTGDLWITEGVKKADALTSQGLPTLALAGVWMWCVPKVRPYKLKPCFDHVRLRARRVYVVFDSDALTKPEVQQALEALVEALEELGAEVLAVYLEDAPDGSKVGADDFLAAGGTVAELKVLARRFKPEDLHRIRLSRDEALRTAIAAERRGWWAYDWSRMVGTGEKPNSMRGHTARDVMKVLIDKGGRRGRIKEGTLELRVATREIADAAATSRQSVMKALRNLEAAGLIEILEADAAEKARSYRLLAGRATLDQEGGEGDEFSTGVPGGKDLRAPRLRWSSPGRKARRGHDKETRRVRDNVQPAVEGVRRLGKVRGAVVDTLEAAGGELQLEDLYGRINPGKSPGDRKRWRPRDLRRRTLPMLEDAGILAVDGDTVTLAGDWLERLEEARELGGEIERGEIERERHRKQREAFRRRGETAPDRHYANVPGAAGHVEDLRPVEAEQEEGASPTPPEFSGLAAAVRGYLDANPHDADQLPGWLGGTLWALDLVEGKRPPSPGRIREALEDLGGEAYRRELLERARETA